MQELDWAVEELTSAFADDVYMHVKDSFPKHYNNQIKKLILNRCNVSSSLIDVYLIGDKKNKGKSTDILRKTNDSMYENVKDSDKIHAKSNEKSSINTVNDSIIKLSELGKRMRKGKPNSDSEHEQDNI